MDRLLTYLLLALLALALTPTVLLLALIAVPLLAAEAISAAVSVEQRDWGGHGLSAVRTRVRQN